MNRDFMYTLARSKPGREEETATRDAENRLNRMRSRREKAEI